jgi:prolyl-tRNA editing enzyme YbaK/EbsC (Cys-tRNA(Pro) deacylase)
MSVIKVQEYFKVTEKEGQVIIPDRSSATVELAAQALGTETDRIAKTLSFMVDDGPILIVVSGESKVDNRKFKDRFRKKAKMIPWGDVERLTGHPPGGVCPFGVLPSVKVYMDESLRKYGIVYPAAGNDHSAVKLTIPELELTSGSLGWVDVCKE